MSVRAASGQLIELPLRTLTNHARRVRAIRHMTDVPDTQATPPRTTSHEPRHLGIKRQGLKCLPAHYRCTLCVHANIRRQLTTDRCHRSGYAGLTNRRRHFASVRNDAAVSQGHVNPRHNQSPRSSSSVTPEFAIPRRQLTTNSISKSTVSR